MTNVNEKPSLRDQQRETQKTGTRAKVFAAAVEVFCKDGVQEALIDDIARLAGVSRGTFYFHFPTKDDVLAELLRKAQEPVAAAIEALPPHASVTTILEALVAAVMAHWPGEAKLFPEVGLTALRLAATGALTSETDPVRRAVSRRFRAAAARGELTRALPGDQLADVFLMSAVAVLMAWSKDPILSLEEALFTAGKVFLEGARAKKRR